MNVFLDASVLFSVARPESLMARFIARFGLEASFCSNGYAI